MYKVMIVDDDQDVCEHLKDMIEWDRLELQLVCEAKDSESAQELFNIYHPQIIFMDICIPGMTGIELSAVLCKTNPNLRVILITGYTDFEYARAAVSIGAVDLLSKPLIPEAVNKSLEKVVDYYIQEKARLLTDNSIRRLLEENDDVLRERFILHLIQSPSNYDAEQVRAQLKVLKLDVQGKLFTVVRILFSEFQNIRTSSEVQLAILMKILNSRLNDNGLTHIPYFHENCQLHSLIIFSQDNEIEEIEEILNKLHEELEFMFQIQITAGIGGTADRLEEIPVSALQAQTAVNYCEVLDGWPIVNFKNVQSVGQIDETILAVHTDWNKVLTENIKAQRYEEIVRFLVDWFKPLSGHTPTHGKACDFATEYLLNLRAVCAGVGIRLWSKEECWNINEKITAGIPQDQMLNLLLSSTKKAVELIRQKKQENSTQKLGLIDMAKQYVQQHMSDENLSLGDVSRHIGLSNTYFGRMFNSEEHMSFSNYVKQQRIQRAKELLSDTNLRVSEVAYEVGFSNANYFSYTFNSMLGMSPMEYRRSARSRLLEHNA